MNAAPTERISYQLRCGPIIVHKVCNIPVDHLEEHLAVLRIMAHHGDVTRVIHQPAEQKGL